MEKRILVVDDEPNIRRMLRVVLAARGYDVREANSGEEALEAMHSEKCDLLLLDINMPGITGIELSKQLRTDSSNSDVAIVMMSTGEQHRARSLEAGADDYLSKPFDVARIFACVEANLKVRGRKNGAG